MMATDTMTDFTIAFRNQASLPANLEADLRAEVDRRLQALMEGHDDMINAEVTLEELTGDTTPHTYEARVVVYMRPESVVGVEKQDTPMGALKGSLSAVEHQVREQRKKLRETWKQP